MQLRALVMLVIALLMGAVAVFLVNMILQSGTEERTTVQAVETTPVVVAATDIDTGTQLTDVMMQVVEWPSESLPDGSYSRTSDVITDTEKPPIVLQTMKRGEMVLPYKITPHGLRGGVPAKIPEDMRAITIGVNEITGVGGFLRPLDYVDILHTTTVGRKDNMPVTRTLVQNVQILGVDQISSENMDKPKVVNSVTLLVNPTDGKRIVLAMRLGSLSLMLRNEIDASLVADEMVTYKDLLIAGPEKKTRVIKRVRRKVIAPKSDILSIEVIRGLNVDQERVKEGEEPSTGTGTESEPASTAN